MARPAARFREMGKKEKNDKLYEDQKKEGGDQGTRSSKRERNSLKNLERLASARSQRKELLSLDLSPGSWETKTIERDPFREEKQFKRRRKDF